MSPEKKKRFVFYISLLFCYSSVQQERSDPAPSCVSLRSDKSMDYPIDFKNDNTPTDLRYITF